MTDEVRFHLNGESRVFRTAPDTRLVTILRDDCKLTATKISCGIGRCGSCMVMMNDQAINSCMVMAWQLTGTHIVSPEGLDGMRTASLVREALVAEAAFQCGYCAPGFTVALISLFMDDPCAGDEAIRRALEGNICRCTGYASIFRGAQRARELLAQEATVPCR